MSEIILKNIYKNIKNIAVIGISPKEDRPSNKVSLELQKRAYKIIPINPNYEEVLGEKAYKDIADTNEKIDIAVLFVNSNRALEEVKKTIDKKVSYIWLQEGVISEEAKRLAEEVGIPFMMDRCIYKTLKKIEEEN
ncbi:MAG: CoA-binding protein [Fusobacteriaceae bacterium]|nr:CoA-binding protein [Fusobacteriaceae bacterium]